MKRYLALFLVLISVLACGMGNRPGKAPSGVPAHLAEVHDFTLPAISGEKVTLASLKGYVILISFWAPWCPPCRKEMPSMQRLYETIGNNKFEILAVAIKEDPSIVKSFVDEYKYSFPVLLDNDGSVARKYRVQYIPTNILIDKNGAAVFRESGAQDWDSEESIQLIQKLIDE